MKSRPAFILAVAAASALLMPRVSRAEEISILNGSVAVEAGRYHHYAVKVDLRVMRDAAIIGHVQARGGTGNDIAVKVMTESGFLNWKNGHTNTPLYNSGRVTAADVRARITESGTYYVVLSNTFSTLTPKTVEGSLRLSWTPPPPPPPPPQPGAQARPAASVPSEGRNFFLVLVLLSVMAMGGFVALWVRHQERTRAGGESEKKAA